MRHADHAGAAEVAALTYGEQAQTARALEIRVRQLENDAENVHALALDMERLARERCGADGPAPAPDASTDTILSAARDALQAPSAETGDDAVSETVSALIKIRDDLLHGGDGTTMARWAYDQLGDVLELEGVKPLEERGSFNAAYPGRTVAATVRSRAGDQLSGAELAPADLTIPASYGPHRRARMREAAPAGAAGAVPRSTTARSPSWGWMSNSRCRNPGLLP